MNGAFSEAECKLIELRDSLKRIELDQAEKKRWNHEEGWWEVCGYRKIIDGALERMRKHHRRQQKCIERSVQNA